MKIIDNINSLFGEELKQGIDSNSKLKIAASCFSIFAYEALKSELEKVDSLEFIFTSPSFITEDTLDRIKKEHRQFHIPNREFERTLHGSEFEIRLKNQLTQKAIARECAQWIRKKATFKSNASDFSMQQFACVSNGNDANAFTPLQGFTAVDLGYQKGNSVSNYINMLDDNHEATSYIKLFDEIWNDQSKLEDVTETITRHIETVYQENSPERIYFLILYNIFNEFLEDINEDLLPNDRTGYQDSEIWKKLFNFQRDAATGIINKLEKFNGCILADSVGLGKTYTALAVIKYYELRNRSVLVLCPKKLADNWLNFNRNLTTNIFTKDRFNYDVLCHTDLQRTSGESFGTRLDRVNWGNYDLIVIDESHNFRNNDIFKDRETRYQKLMQNVIRQGVKTKVLMLSATPVNNRFTDLRNQLALAYEGESESLQKMLKAERSIEEIFRSAQTVFNQWSKLKPSERTAQSILERLDFDFFEVLDSVTIARSRRHIETFYDTKDIGRFPTRLKPIAFRSPLTNRADVPKFSEIYQQLTLLKLSVYAPVSYIQPSKMAKYEELYDTEVEGGKGRLKQIDRERSLQSLMTTNLLKRLESSVEAFRLTLDGLKTNYSATLERISEFRKSGRQIGIDDWIKSFAEMENEDDDFIGLSEDIIGEKIRISLADMDLLSWEHDLTADLIVIEDLLESMNRVSVEDDSKLQHLIDHISTKIQNPINPRNKKVLIFTAFADTANYLYQNIAPTLSKSFHIEAGRVTGSDAPKNTIKKGYDFQSILTLFAPIAKEKSLTMPQETGEIDILIATDCISEGQNLQDCDYLINYDIHWNPVRIIQRFGRIDRIGSPNEIIQLVNYWPDISLDEYINLKERVENRMVIVDVSATGDDNVLTARSSEISFRKEQLRRLQDEVIEMEDLKTGVTITDLGLNDFRMDLLQYLKENEDLTKLPTGMHTVIQPNDAIGLEPGVIFVLRSRNTKMTVSQSNRLHPYYLIYLRDNGDTIIPQNEVKHHLDLLRSSCKGLVDPIYDACSRFNKKTRDGRKMDHYSNLLNEGISHIKNAKAEDDVESLFSNTQTSALTGGFTGLDDFELIAFVVVKDSI